MENKISFGSMNIETGETQDGYMKNGEMKFKPEPWYKRWFRKRPEKTEYFGLVTIEKKIVWSGVWEKINVPVYRTCNPHTGKTIKLRGDHREQGIYFNVDEFDKNQRFIIH